MLAAWVGASLAAAGTDVLTGGVVGTEVGSGATVVDAAPAGPAVVVGAALVGVVAC